MYIDNYATIFLSLQEIIKIEVLFSWQLDQFLFLCKYSEY